MMAMVVMAVTVMMMLVVVVGDTRIPAGTVEMAEKFCEQHRQGCFQVSVQVT